MERIYTIQELASIVRSNPDYLDTLRKKYAIQQDILPRLRVEFISKNSGRKMDHDKLKLVLREVKARGDLRLPGCDDVRWHTFSTEQYGEAKGLVRAMMKNEEEITEMVKELED